MYAGPRLRAAFLEVRAEFFPRWDRQRRWKVRSGPRSAFTRELGYCDDVRRLVFVRPTKNGDYEDLMVLLVHEICHAFSPRRGARWRQRMLAAADRARALSRATLERKLREDVRDDEQPPLTAAEYIYGEASDLVISDGVSDYRALVRALAQRCSIPPRILERKYPRLRREYQVARAFVDEAKAARAGLDVVRMMTGIDGRPKRPNSPQRM